MKPKNASGPKRRTERGRDLRTRIIGVAENLFTERGFSEATVEEIARRAGIAKGTVYLYFKDKTSLYAGIIDEQFSRALRFLKETQARPISNPDKLRDVADDWLGHMLKYKHKFPMFTMENVDMTRKLMRGIHVTAFRRVGEIVDHIARIIESGVARGEFRKIDPKIGAMYFLNSIQAVFLTSTMFPECRDPKKQIMRMLFNGLIKETE